MSGEYLASTMHLDPHQTSGLSCCPFWGDDSAVAYLLCVVANNVCVGVGKRFCWALVVGFFVSLEKDGCFNLIVL